jgi:hypothetical protein
MGNVNAWFVTKRDDTISVHLYIVQSDHVYTGR